MLEQFQIAIARATKLMFVNTWKHMETHNGIVSTLVQLQIQILTCLDDFELEISADPPSGRVC